MNDPLAQWRHAGSHPASAEKNSGPRTIRLREYKAFVADSERQAFLRICRGTVKNPESTRSYPAGYLNQIIDDDYGFTFTLIYNLPLEGPLAIQFIGEGLTCVVDAILRGYAREVQIFDPDRFIAPPEGDFDIEADAWRGGPVIKDITFNPAIPEKNMRH